MSIVSYLRDRWKILILGTRTGGFALFRGLKGRVGLVMTSANENRSNNRDGTGSQHHSDDNPRDRTRGGGKILTGLTCWIVGGHRTATNTITKSSFIAGWTFAVRVTFMNQLVKIIHETLSSILAFERTNFFTLFPGITRFAQTAEFRTATAVRPAIEVIFANKGVGRHCSLENNECDGKRSGCVV